jgi:hypothetical protein
MRGNVPGKEPPPCAKATRNFGSFSKSPLKIMLVMAMVVSTGMATSQGIQYLSMRSFAPACPRDARTRPCPVPRTLGTMGSSRGSPRFTSFHVRADLNALQADALAALQFLYGQFGILHGQGAQARRNGWGGFSTIPAMWSLRNMARSSVSFGLAQ